MLRIGSVVVLVATTIAAMSCGGSSASQQASATARQATALSTNRERLLGATALAANPSAAAAASTAAIATFRAKPTSAAKLPYDVALLARSCTRQFGYVTCEGSVKNVTGHSIEHVTAVVEWSTGEPGTAFVIQRSDEAVISYDPLLPGQESPWKVIGSDNPLLTQFRVRFKLLLGGTLVTDYSAVTP